MKINYNNRRFVPTEVSENGDVDNNLIFKYIQKGVVLTCDYHGGRIKRGHIIGIVNKINGVIEIFYHQIIQGGQLKAGKCISQPEILEDGRIRLIENWEWLTGDLSKGTSVLIEIADSAET